MLEKTVLDLYDVSSVTLWVEDDLTRVFLTKIWRDLKIRVLTAGGRQGVEFFVGGAPSALKGKTVVGLIDRDFSPPNDASWGNVTSPIIRTPTHEFENLLLDFDLLEALCGQNAADIKSMACDYARKIKWWMTCKTARHEAFGALSAYFPSEPPVVDIVDEKSATEHLVASDYWKQHREVLATYQDPKFLSNRVAQIAADYDRHLASGEWLQSFSGKEIFRHVRSDVPRLRALAKGGTAAERDENLASLMARTLRMPAFAQSSTLKRFQEIRTALRKRAGLTP